MRREEVHHVHVVHPMQQPQKASTGAWIAIAIMAPFALLVLACGGCFTAFALMAPDRESEVERIDREARAVRVQLAVDQRPMASEDVQEERLQTLVQDVRTGWLARMPLLQGTTATIHVDPEFWERKSDEDKKSLCEDVLAYLIGAEAGWQDPTPGGHFTVRIRDATTGDRIGTYTSAGMLSEGGAYLNVGR